MSAWGSKRGERRVHSQLGDVPGPGAENDDADAAVPDVGSAAVPDDEAVRIPFGIDVSSELMGSELTMDTFLGGIDRGGSVSSSSLPRTAMARGESDDGKVEGGKNSYAPSLPPSHRGNRRFSSGVDGGPKALDGIDEETGEPSLERSRGHGGDGVGGKAISPDAISTIGDGKPPPEWTAASGERRESRNTGLYGRRTTKISNSSRPMADPGESADNTAYTTEVHDDNILERLLEAQKEFEGDYGGEGRIIPDDKEDANPENPQQCRGLLAPVKSSGSSSFGGSLKISMSGRNADAIDGLTPGRTKGIKTSGGSGHSTGGSSNERTRGDQEPRRAGDEPGTGFGEAASKAPEFIDDLDLGGYMGWNPPQRSLDGTESLAISEGGMPRGLAATVDVLDSIDGLGNFKVPPERSVCDSKGSWEERSRVSIIEKKFDEDRGDRVSENARQYPTIKRRDSLLKKKDMFLAPPRNGSGSSMYDSNGSLLVGFCDDEEAMINMAAQEFSCNSEEEEEEVPQQQPPRPATPTGSASSLAATPALPPQPRG